MANLDSYLKKFEKPDFDKDYFREIHKASIQLENAWVKGDVSEIKEVVQTIEKNMREIKGQIKDQLWQNL